MPSPETAPLTTRPDRVSVNDNLPMCAPARSTSVAVARMPSTGNEEGSCADGVGADGDETETGREQANAPQAMASVTAVERFTSGDLQRSATRTRRGLDQAPRRPSR